MSTRRLFATPGKHTAFAGVSNLSKHSHVSPKKIKIDLEEIDAYTRKREIKRPRVYNPYFVWEPRKLIQIDLIDFSKDSAMVRKNGGHRYLFCAIDSFSRFVWVKPMKRKNQNVSLETYVAMAREFGRKPQRVLCDKGGEFTSSAFRQMFASHGTTLIALNRKAGTVERFQRSLQSLIYKFIAYTGKKRFVHCGSTTRRPSPRGKDPVSKSVIKCGQRVGEMLTPEAIKTPLRNPFIKSWV